MEEMDQSSPEEREIPVINLDLAPGQHKAWDRPKIIIYFWSVCELLFVTNSWQISSGLRVKILRLFGAKIGSNVVFRPRTRVKFPWKLTVGDRVWIGEGVWIHNQDQVVIGHDVVISQESFITTGSHSIRTDMGLLTKPTVIEPGVWLTTRCIVLGGVTVGRSSVVGPGTVVNQNVPPNLVIKTTNEIVGRPRFSDDSKGQGN